MTSPTKKPPHVFDVIAATVKDTPAPCRLWGSVRMTYTICAFLAMILHLCMRNMLNFVILCMVKVDDVANETVSTLEISRCSVASDVVNNTTPVARNGDLPWTRHQEFSLQGTFYYGYLITLPVGGFLADKFGGKLFFVHSITIQALVFLLMPICARLSYAAMFTARILQGLIAGAGTPAIYQLFSTWAHPTERTTLLSFAYGGFSLGSLIIFPISSFLCQFGWEIVFYAVGGVSFLVGLSFQWLVYSSLEEHPRISSEERDFLKVANDVKNKKCAVPWRAIFTSVPVYAFTLTHIFHNYGIIVLTLMIPRFLKEAMGFSLAEVGVLSAAIFLGSCISKIITIASCRVIEKRPSLNLTVFRRIFYVICNIATVLLIIAITLLECEQRIIVVLLTMFIGITTDLAFSGGYWPSLLFIAPTYSGLLSGMANSLSTFSGFLAPLAISGIVSQGTKAQWDYVMLTLVAFYGLGAVIYGTMGSSKLQHWGQSSPAASSPQ